MGKNKPIVHKADGKTILQDATSFINSSIVAKDSCKILFDLNTDRVLLFKKRLTEKRLSPNRFVIVVINVCDPCGNHIARILRPDTDWKSMIEDGQNPLLICLADRRFTEKAIGIFDKDALKKLKKTTGVAVVVVDNEVADIFCV